MNRRKVATLGALAVAVSLGYWMTEAGPLDPPAGPVASTGRFGPRTEVNEANTPGGSSSLFRITQPGSYYLGGNITGVAGKNGIEIDADEVTLDLNGFALLGVAGSLDGVIAQAPGKHEIARRVAGLLSEFGKFDFGQVLGIGMVAVVD